LIKIVMI